MQFEAMSNFNRFMFDELGLGTTERLMATSKKSSQWRPDTYIIMQKKNMPILN